MNEKKDLAFGKYEGVVLGKLKIEIPSKNKVKGETEEYEINFFVKDRVMLEDYFGHLTLAGTGKINISEKKIERIEKRLNEIFRESFPETKKETIANFVSLRFEDILMGIAISFGMFTEEGIKEHIYNLFGDDKKKS